MNSYLRFSALVFQMAAIIGLFAYVGYQLDEQYNPTTGTYFIICSLLGIFISFYLLFKELKNLK
ncbi:AtpZ/AtpI family protein [Schleiferia thermophila]|uniref:AtpZ/AtpI family protein n=1 Tax=Schleiferia thermophila TaxID=884107 RepID=UPI000F625015|nr:AtpZ/AtpI family protein [Schleiferia thermophila]GCD80155.1 hypothetical protein JCM30197_14020 [Schleiferia thermophila]